MGKTRCRKLFIRPKTSRNGIRSLIRMVVPIISGRRKTVAKSPRDKNYVIQKMVENIKNSWYI